MRKVFYLCFKTAHWEFLISLYRLHSISGPFDDVDDSKEQNFELGHFCGNKQLPLSPVKVELDILTQFRLLTSYIYENIYEFDYFHPFKVYEAGLSVDAVQRAFSPLTSDVYCHYFVVSNSQNNELKTVSLYWKVATSLDAN